MDQESPTEYPTDVWPIQDGTEADWRVDFSVALPEWQQSDRVVWLRRHRLEQGNKCHYCGAWLTAPEEDPLLKATLDHVVPLSLGGEHSFDNTVAACWLCNTAKKSMTPEEARTLLPHHRIVILNTIERRTKNCPRNMKRRRQRARMRRAAARDQ